MIDEKLFEPILDNDEKILKMYAPNKKRAWFGTIAWIVLMALWLIPSTVIAFVSGGDGVIAGILFAAFDLMFLIVPIVLIALWCGKTIYAVTNKRIIIRTGYIGVDFKSLEYHMLGAIAVNVNVWDKILRSNTGSISFGSMSSPLTNQGAAKFAFLFVNKPYETNKEIKAIIDEYRFDKKAE